jgi:putative ATP-binding cassette transporter
MTADATTQPDAPADAQGFHLDARVASAFGRFAGGFWVGDSARRAWLLTLGLAASLILSTYITVQMNHWNRWFFDALEKKDVATVKQAMGVFFLIVACMAAIGVAIVYTRETLQVRWREWLVKALLGRWLHGANYHHLQTQGVEPPNPEYRISDDSRWATEILVDLGIGLLSAVVGGIAFVSILWSVGGAITVGGVVVPGYMVWLALIYGVLASLLMARVGKPLVGRVGTKNEAEGYFRFAMMRLRDNAAKVAEMRGDRAERHVLGRYYDALVERWLGVVRSHCHVTWITNSSGPMIPIIPLLFAAPKYLSGDLSLGQVTQLAAAFVQVQSAISWLVDNYNRIAEWYASARRVMDIVDACDRVEPIGQALAAAPWIVRTGGRGLGLKDVEFADPSGRRLISVEELAVQPGELVHISGPSSIGKSAIARVVAGLARPERGEVRLPQGAVVALAPQRPYLPLGGLADALRYPGGTAHPGDPAAALQAVGLGHLGTRSNEIARWDQSLSLAEQQRLSIARVMVHEPSVVILDDTLSALADGERMTLLGVLRYALPQAIILSFAQRPLPTGVATRQMIFESGTHGAELRTEPAVAQAMASSN